MIYITLIDPANLPDIWSKIEGYLQMIAARSRGRWTVENIAVYIINRSWELWVVFEEDDEAPSDAPNVLAVATSEIVEYPQYRALVGTGLAGREMKKWVHLLSVVEDWARARGCKAIQLSTRPGLAKQLSGYKATHVMYEKSLEVYDA